MSVAIPTQLQFSPSLPVLPSETVNTSVVISPSNGNSFNPSSNSIIFDLPTSGYLDPSTLTLRFKLVVENATSSVSMLGGAYSVINRLQVYFGSQTVENISNWNMLYTDLVNLSYNAAQKANLAITHGFLDLGATDPDLVNVNNRLISASGSTIYVAIPLVCLLSSAEKLLPLGMMSAVRVELTLAQISEIFSGTTVTNYTVSNVEASMDVIKFGSGVDALVRSMGEKIFIKSQSMSVIGSTLTSGSSGNLSLIFNQRVSSLKGVALHISGNDSTKCLNKIFDSVDVTTDKGSYQFQVNGINYPPKPLSTQDNKASCMAELRNFVSGFHSIQGSNMSIVPKEYFYTQASTTSLTAPGKFIIGVSTEKIQDARNALLTGISTSNSPITCILQLSQATTQACTLYLIALYDVLIECDLVMKSATVKQ
jgi:hypothetical protein